MEKLLLQERESKEEAKGHSKRRCRESWSERAWAHRQITASHQENQGPIAMY